MHFSYGSVLAIRIIFRISLSQTRSFQRAASSPPPGPVAIMHRAPNGAGRHPARDLELVLSRLQVKTLQSFISWTSRGRDPAPHFADSSARMASAPSPSYPLASAYFDHASATSLLREFVFWRCAEWSIWVVPGQVGAQKPFRHAPRK